LWAASALHLNQMDFRWTMRGIVKAGLAFVLIAMLASLCWADQAYVSDTLEITMRTGPSTSHKIIAMLTSGQPVDVVETSEGWSRIKVLDGDGAGREGWVLSRFLIQRAPWKAQYDAMQATNNELKDRYGNFEQRWQELSQREQSVTQQLKETTDKLQQLQGQYDKLKEGSANYLKLKGEYDQTRSALEVAQKDLQRLSNENQSLKYSQNIKWFATGALVPFFGWLVGLFMGRRQKRPRPGLYK
jgi:SH3 domain protein